MHFDLKLWSMTRGMRGRMVSSVVLGLLALGVGIARFAFLGLFIAGVFRGDPDTTLAWPLGGAAAAILLRGVLDHARTMIAHRVAAEVQQSLRGRLFDQITALGPAWFGAEVTDDVAYTNAALAVNAERGQPGQPA